jgi:hypothetical protein
MFIGVVEVQRLSPAARTLFVGRSFHVPDGVEAISICVFRVDDSLEGGIELPLGHGERQTSAALGAVRRDEDDYSA